MKTFTFLKSIRALWLAVGALVGAGGMGMAFAGTFLSLPGEVAAHTDSIVSLSRRTYALEVEHTRQSAALGEVLVLVRRQTCLDLAEREKKDWRPCLQDDVESLLERYEGK